MNFNNSPTGFKRLFSDVRDNVVDSVTESNRKELEISIRVEALERLLAIAEDFKHKDSFNANKLLLQGGWISEDNNSSVVTKGRPSKEAIRQEVTRLASLEQQYIKDMERINNVEQNQSIPN